MHVSPCRDEHFLMQPASSTLSSALYCCCVKHRHGNRASLVAAAQLEAVNLPSRKVGGYVWSPAPRPPPLFLRGSANSPMQWDQMQKKTWCVAFRMGWRLLLWIKMQKKLLMAFGVWTPPVQILFAASLEANTPEDVSDVSAFGVFFPYWCDLSGHRSRFNTKCKQDTKYTFWTESFIFLSIHASPALSCDIALAILGTCIKASSWNRQVV